MRRTTSRRPISTAILTSSENDVARRLRRIAHRREPGEVLLEGPRVIQEAALAGVELELLVVREDARPPEVQAARTVVLSERLFNALSTTVTPQGVMAVAHRDTVPLDAARRLAREAGWPLVVLDGVQDPGNAGAICRTAAAAGAPAVAVLEGTADPLGPKAVRASAGNVFRLALARAERAQLDGLTGYGAAASGGEPLGGADLRNADLLVLGSEAHGLRTGGLRLVTIPMAEGVESLNVAAAAAILLFEVRRRL